MSYAVILALALTGAQPAAGAPSIQWTYLYRLATLTGNVATTWATVGIDRRSGELLMVDGAAGVVRILNASGMQTYEFGDDEALGQPVAVAPLGADDLLVIAIRRGERVVQRCNFRGEVQGPFELRDVPPAFAAEFLPDAVFNAAGRVYVADTNAWRVLAFDENGTFSRAYDLGKMLELDAAKKADNSIVGLSVDVAGNILFAVPTFFQAFIVSPAGELRAFGVRGSSPGKFNLVGGIAADEQGYVYVSDQLRAVVMVFDPNLSFLGEFGYRGRMPHNLIAPRVSLAAAGKVYVSQSAGRGVSVFNVVPVIPVVDPEPAGATR